MLSSMEMIIAAVASVAAAVSAVVAIVQARQARSSKTGAASAERGSEVARDESARLAAIANAAFIRQAEAQERANELKEAELRPPVWTGPKWVSGDLYRMVNSSGRDIYCTQFDVQPDGTEKLVRVYGAEDGIYRFGDSLDYMASKRLGLAPRKLTILWRYADEPDAEMSSWIIPL